MQIYSTMRYLLQFLVPFLLQVFFLHLFTKLNSQNLIHTQLVRTVTVCAMHNIEQAVLNLANRQERAIELFSHQQIFRAVFPDQNIFIDLFISDANAT